MQIFDQTFTETTQVLDGAAFANCRFEKCKLIYRGGPIPNISDCRFDNCTWHFEDAAERTLVFLKMIYHGMGTSGPELVESTFKSIRTA